MKVFLTGISGLLGTNLTIALLEKGYEVRGFIRDSSRYKGPLDANLEIVQGSLTNDLSPLLADTDVVIHAAAETNQHHLSYSHYKSVNCDATIQLLNAAIRSRVKKFVFVSTTNTLGYGSMDDLGDEQKLVKFPFNASFYAKSKLEAERALLQLKDQAEVIIINPGFMIGAYDSRPSSGRIILMGLNKKIIFYPEGGRSFVHVKDVAQGIINSLEKGINGERYLLVNENLTYEAFFRKLNNMTHQTPLMIKIPRMMLMLLGYGGNVLRRVGIPTSISSVNMRILCINNFYSNKKSIQELGMVYQPIENAISEAVTYFTKTKNHRDH
jgi:nucleoside-diphosphate-sugar epimerase